MCSKYTLYHGGLEWNFFQKNWSGKRQIGGDRVHFTEYLEYCGNFFGRWTSEIFTLKGGKTTDFRPDFGFQNGGIKTKKMHIHVKSKSRTYSVGENFKEKILSLAVFELFHFFRFFPEKILYVVI